MPDRTYKFTWKRAGTTACVTSYFKLTEGVFAGLHACVELNYDEVDSEMFVVAFVLVLLETPDSHP